MINLCANMLNVYTYLYIDRMSDDKHEGRHCELFSLIIYKDAPIKAKDIRRSCMNVHMAFSYIGTLAEIAERADTGRR